MTNLLNQLNLRPQERRLVVGAFAVLFVVVNVWLVWPHFSDWNLAANDLAKSKSTLEIYRRETDTNRVAELQARFKELQGLGSSVLPAEQSLDLIRAIQNQAIQSGVQINSQSEVVTSSNTKTNEFFEEKARLITVVTREEELVDFLVSLGSSNSIIRVRSMVLRPETPSFYRLQGNITLVASYQKNRAKKAEPAGAAKPKMLPPGSRTAAKKS